MGGADSEDTICHANCVLRGVARGWSHEHPPGVIPQGAGRQFVETNTFRSKSIGLRGPPQHECAYSVMTPNVPPKFGAGSKGF